MPTPFFKPSAPQIVRWIEVNIPNHSVRKSGKRGDIYLVDNPTIPGDSGQHIGICPAEGWVHDFRPHMAKYSGSFLKFVMNIRSCSFQEAIKEVCGQGVNIRSILAARRVEQPQEETDEIVSDITLPDYFFPLTSDTLPIAKAVALSYLKSRQLSEEEANKYKVHYSSIAVLFPYIEYGELVYWQSRELINKKYMFPVDSGGKSVEDFLHGFDFVEPNTEIILVESIFNEVVIGEGALATGGAALKHKQFRRIRNVLLPNRIILAPDNDDAGITSLERNFKILNQSFRNKIWYCIPPNPHKDWNDMAKALDRLNNRSVIRDYIEQHAKQLDLAQLMKITLKRQVS